MHSDAFDSKRLLIVGSPLENRVGAHLRRAAEALGINAQVVDLRTAYSPSRLENWAYRVFRDNRMPRMAAFSRDLLAFTSKWVFETFRHYDFVFTPRRTCIEQIRQLGERESVRLRSR